MTETEPIKQINGVCWYYPGGKERADAEDVKTKHEGEIEIYPGWVKLGRVQATWIPREDVEQILDE
jgi:hypothetical protein